MFLTRLGATGDFSVKPVYEPYDHSHIRAAGKPSATALAKQAAEAMATPDQPMTHTLQQPYATTQAGDRPPTPEKLSRFRNPNMLEPGTMIRHPGLAQDPLPEGVFGKKSAGDKEGGVVGVMRAEQRTAIQQYRQEQSEAIYASHKREPLGTGFTRGHKIPAPLGTEVPFGRPANAIELDKVGQVRQIMAAAAEYESQVPDAHDMYVRSHGNYGPGEQRKRNYEWKDIDPAERVFGAKNAVPATQSTLGTLLKHEERTVVSKLQADFNLLHHDALGRPRTLGMGDRPHLAPDHAFGRPSRITDEWGVDKLLKGETPAADLAPDADLGRSIRPGFRNIAPSQRVFGVPSVRLDVPTPRNRSIADGQNYGNEPTTASLLFPAPGADRGLTDEVMTTPRPRVELLDLVQASGIDLDDVAFARIFALAAGGGERCSLAAFMQMRRALELKGGA